MFRDDEEDIKVPHSSSVDALLGKQMHARERQKRQEQKQKRELLKLKVSVNPQQTPQAPAKRDQAPDTFGTKTIEQIVEKQMKPTSQQTPNPDAMIQQEEDRQQTKEQRPYEEQQQVG